MKIVVDSNIFFSALLSKNNLSKQLLFNGKYDFYSCNFLFLEVFKYKEKISKISSLSEDEILLNLKELLQKIYFVKEDLIPKDIFLKAFNICKDIDEKDTPFIALSIFLNAKLLTGDKKLSNGLKEKNFNVCVEISDLM